MYFIPTLPLQATIRTMSSAIISIAIHISLLIGFSVLVVQSSKIIPPTSTQATPMQWYLTNAAASASTMVTNKPQTVFNKPSSNSTATRNDSIQRSAEKTPLPRKIVQQAPAVEMQNHTSSNESADFTPITGKHPDTQATPHTDPTNHSSQPTDSSLPLTLPSSNAAHLKNPPPIYPLASRRLEEEGKVLLQVFILANGTVGAIKIQQSSGYERLDHAAIQAVRTWQFMPAKRGNIAIDYWHIQPIQFTLES